MNILLADFLTENGHRNLLKSTYDILSLSHNVTVFTTKNYLSLCDIEGIGLSDAYNARRNNKYSFIYNQIKFILSAKYHIQKKKYDAIIINGFENITFSVIWRATNVPTYLISHDNLTRKSLSLFFHQKITRKATHLFYEQYIADQLTSLKTNVFPHPINSNIEKIRTHKKKIIKGQIFCPSASSNEGELILLERFVTTNQSFSLIAKTHRKIKSDTNITYKLYHENYEELLLNSEFIFIPFDFDLRVSGVFYDAMALNKLVISINNKSMFIQNMQKKYPHSVYNLKSAHLIENLQVNENKKNDEYQYFLSKHESQNIAKILDKILTNNQ